MVGAVTGDSAVRGGLSTVCRKRGQAPHGEAYLWGVKSPGSEPVPVFVRGVFSTYWGLLAEFGAMGVNVSAAQGLYWRVVLRRKFSSPDGSVLKKGCLGRKKEPIEEPGVVPGWALFSTRVVWGGPDWIPEGVVRVWGSGGRMCTC
jgi:hypothetical protein